jgi:methylated-DNA-[protein]-cysteine S-methyltransferase
MKTYFVYDTPIGKITIGCSGDSLSLLVFGKPHKNNGENRRTLFSDEVYRQIKEYFSGARREFDLPLYREGTQFQKRVWDALCTIPYGQTRSYSEIAAQIGSPRAARAVGMANHVNPIAIIVPCHRVIGKNGSLTGYASGTHIKRRLLDLEAKNSLNLI